LAGADGDPHKPPPLEAPTAPRLPARRSALAPSTGPVV
jgi:hypothetical protein